MTSIKFIVTLFILTLFITSSCSSKQDNSKLIDTSKSINKIQKDTSLNGLYAGLEEMCWTDSTGKKDCYSDPANPKRKWYHLGYLKIKGDSVFLDQDPVNIYKNDTAFSASDGAFYYYSGTLQKNGTTILINPDELLCGYCAVPEKRKADGTYEVIKRTKKWKGTLTSKGILIDGNLYAKTSKNEMMISEHPESYLKAQ